jgi:hypothetical protein
MKNNPETHQHSFSAVVVVALMLLFMVVLQIRFGF